MVSHETEHMETVLDLKLLTQFVHEFNIYRRNVAAYPGNHPVIAASVQKVLHLLEQLFVVQGEFTIGVAKDALMINQGILDKANPVYRDLARSLFSQGIATITFRHGLDSSQLERFNAILGQKREALKELGGIANVLEREDVTHIRVREIDYDAFYASEEMPEAAGDGLVPSGGEGLWKDFINGLLAGRIDPTGQSGAMAPVDPHQFADMINRLHVGGDSSAELQGKILADLLNGVDRPGIDRKQRDDLFDRLGKFIGRLSPELRRQFLRTTFDTLAEHESSSEQILGKIPEELLLDTLDDIGSRKASLSPHILGILEKLARHAAPRSRQPVEMADTFALEEVSRKLQVIFTEDTLGDIMPDSYQQTLQTIMVSQQVSARDLEQIEQLKQTIAGHNLEVQTSNVILEIMAADPDTSLGDAFQRNLMELAEYFLEMGDFPALVALHGRLVGKRATSGLPSVHTTVLEQIFSAPEFLSAALDGLVLWGKEKFAPIQQFIEAVGAPFTQPLLNRLADEQNMSLRRFYMDRLLRIRGPLRDELLARLRDNRWYFVRNVVILLRSLNDPTVVKPLGRLINHPHPKVQQEVMKTLLHYRDQEAERLLLRNLNATDEELQLSAIQLAEKSTNPDVLRILLGLLGRGGLRNYEYRLKSAVVNTLAEIGSAEAVPVLVKLLLSRNLFHHGQHKRLKADIMRSVEQYPVDVALDLVRRVVQSGRGELLTMAQESYASLQRKVHGNSPQG